MILSRERHSIFCVFRVAVPQQVVVYRFAGKNAVISTSSLGGRVMFRRAMKRVVQNAMRQGALGITHIGEPSTKRLHRKLS